MFTVELPGKDRPLNTLIRPIHWKLENQNNKCVSASLRVHEIFSLVATTDLNVLPRSGRLLTMYWQLLTYPWSCGAASTIELSGKTLHAPTHLIQNLCIF